MKAAVTAMFNNTMRSSRYTVLGASPLQGSLRCDFGDHQPCCMSSNAACWSLYIVPDNMVVLVLIFKGNSELISIMVIL